MKKLTLIKSTVCVSVLAFMMQGCGQNMISNMNPVEQNALKSFGTSTGNPNNGDFNFKMVSEQVFQPSCIKCHGAQDSVDGIRYDSYEFAIETGSLASLQHSYEGYREPAKECGSISKENMDLVALWIQLGAPQ